ncbi:MAG: hypothetical protein HWN68_00645 [Desulfobacterales bacterium]|nr:hypothetical protein [Desulfobacterales bacterium]
MQETSDNPMAHISKRWESIYDVLCRGDSIFDQMTNLFTLCAAIGHLNGEEKQPENKKGIFRWTNLNSEIGVSILTAIAWDARDRELAILTDKRRIMDIACDFAEGGMQYLYDNFFEDHMQDGQLLRPEKLDVEFNLAQIVEGLRQKQSMF